ncbi:major facilitator superfamily domain-containing protein [Collybia nuda]|uniref:Major facilitator superfamily domain-containing protein n=1 Tax=Collybia nuda TaxID=64659 RepID=A0A9P5YFX6_9AGAR|nr:major facilitator superfamily domain-containing protein [Collybia nuda]
MYTEVDEETSLLNTLQTLKPTPLPWSQISIVLSLQLIEAITSQVIFPFAPQLIRDLGITHGNESQVGYYLGLMQSLFFLTQAIAGLILSRLSDYSGRKPVILACLFGVSASMYWFGLSRTFGGLVLSYSLNGFFNGYPGVNRSILAEITDTTNIAQAFAIIPIAWFTGVAFASLIGGSLSRPAESFPKIFGSNEFLKNYPYFLPCAVSATFTAVVWIVTSIVLKETVQSTVPIFKFLRGNTSEVTNGTASQQLNAISAPLKAGRPLPLRSLLTPKIIIVVGNFALLALVDVMFRAVQPLFYSTPIHLGGMGLPPSTIGNILSVLGFLNGVFQVFFFAKVHDYWGSKKVFMAGITSAIPVFAAFPLINHLTKTQGLSIAVWIIVAIQVILSIGFGFSYGAIFIIITAASPNQATLGATNGLGQITAGIIKAIGPAAANSLFSLSIERNYFGGYLVYYVLVSIVCISVFVGSLLPRH